MEAQVREAVSTLERQAVCVREERTGNRQTPGEQLDSCMLHTQGPQTDLAVAGPLKYGPGGV